MVQMLGGVSSLASRLSTIVTRGTQSAQVRGMGLREVDPSAIPHGTVDAIAGATVKQRTDRLGPIECCLVIEQNSCYPSRSSRTLVDPAGRRDTIWEGTRGDKKKPGKARRSTILVGKRRLVMVNTGAKRKERFRRSARIKW